VFGFDERFDMHAIHPNTASGNRVLFTESEWIERQYRHDVKTYLEMMINDRYFERVDVKLVKRIGDLFGLDCPRSVEDQCNATAVPTVETVSPVQG
jgi:hypothetical protein